MKNFRFRAYFFVFKNLWSFQKQNFEEHKTEKKNVETVDKHFSAKTSRENIACSSNLNTLNASTTHSNFEWKFCYFIAHKNYSFPVHKRFISHLCSFTCCHMNMNIFSFAIFFCAWFVMHMLSIFCCSKVNEMFNHDHYMKAFSSLETSQTRWF